VLCYALRGVVSWWSLGCGGMWRGVSSSSRAGAVVAVVVGLGWSVVGWCAVLGGIE